LLAGQQGGYCDYQQQQTCKKTGPSVATSNTEISKTDHQQQTNQGATEGQRGLFGGVAV
jgi:hypothetical protein